ncbi:MAG: hypothetical protein DRI95_14995 [Bacteroidetes bacterium]|nr:MAG: hypothetical protein DRI95_14995 [Bacteroidota bacterium]
MVELLFCHIAINGYIYIHKLYAMGKRVLLSEKDIDQIVKDLEKERGCPDYIGWVVEDGILIRFDQSRKFNEMMKEKTSKK